MALMTAALVCMLAAVQPAAAPPHDKAFWHGIAHNKYEPPAGASAAALAAELVEALGSPDPELRDDLAYSILTAWIYQKKLLGPNDLRPIAAALTANLRHGIGETHTDSVLRRSFSALVLSVIAARENETPFLSANEFDGLAGAALAYFRDERDVRGFDDTKGWIHSAAHTADLLKFLARNPRLTPARQREVLEAITDKVRDGPVTFNYGEDERIARIPISIVRREDLDRDGFRAWVAALQRMAAFPDEPSTASLRVMTNARHVLSALWTELSADPRPSTGADFARETVKQALVKLF